MPQLPTTPQSSRPQATSSPCQTAAPTTPTTSTTPTTTRTPRTPTSSTWPNTFQVPWEKMTAGLKYAIANSQRPSAADRKNMIRVVVEAMQQHEVNPTKQQCLIVAKNIVSQYKMSFCDILDGNEIGTGYASLLTQLKTRVEHVNRNNTLARRRRERVRVSSTSGGSQSSQGRKGPADQYGCVQWQPDELPQGETAATLETKRQQMLDLYSREGYLAIDRSQLDSLMSQTYYLQRQHINATPPQSLQELKQKWPYLLCQRWMFSHFQTLTDICIYTKMLEGMQTKGQRVIQYFESHPTNDDVRFVSSMLHDVSEEENAKAPAILLMLLAHFKEPRNALFYLADVSV